MNLVFDFGKVVFDWEPAALLARMLPAHAPDEAASHRLVGDFFQHFQGDWGEFDRGRLDAATLAERIEARTGIDRTEARAVIDAVPHALRPLPEVVRLLARLREAGHALYFLSNMPLPYADHLDATHDFLTHFDDGIYSARVGLIKPEPAIFALAVERFGIDPAETLFIDDVEANVLAARLAGWKAIRFESAAGCTADLQALSVLAA